MFGYFPIQEWYQTYQSSPSRNVSVGMVSRISWGRLITFPARENIVFLAGFQKPRIPSYFSNIHLHIIYISTYKINWYYNIIYWGRYQLAGFVWEWMKKHGLVASPIPSISCTCFAKKFSGGASGIASVRATLSIFSLSSGRWARMVAAKLWQEVLNIKEYQQKYNSEHSPFDLSVPPTRHNY